MLANKEEETETGADLGLIVEINVGPLVCRETALIQAKKAKNGRADVGSKNTQLQRQCRRSQQGYYVFYHQADDTPAPGPTVIPAQRIKSIVEQSERSIDARKIELKVLEDGIDFSAFMTFGLCSANSEYGESYETLDEAFGNLRNGQGPGNLPRFLLVVAISNEKQVAELKTRVDRDYARAKQATLSHEPGKSRSPGDPGRGR